MLLKIDVVYAIIEDILERNVGRTLVILVGILGPRRIHTRPHIADTVEFYIS